MQRRAGWITLFVVVLSGGLFAWLAQASVQNSQAPRRHTNRDQKWSSLAPMVASSPQMVDFERDIRLILARSCLACHGPDKALSDFRVDQRASFFTMTDSRPLIVSGDAANSRLIAIVSGKINNMKSAEDHILPTDERMLLETWINAGAQWKVAQ